MECTVNEIQSVAGKHRGQKRAEIAGAVANDLSCDDNFGKRFVGEFEVGIRFVVLEKDVKPGLVLFYKVRFQYEGLDLVINHDKLKIGDDLDQLLCLRVLVTARLKVLPDTIAQVLCLADVDDLAGRIFMNINAGPDGQGFEFLDDRHNSILACGVQSGKLATENTELTKLFYRGDAESQREQRTERLLVLRFKLSASLRLCGEPPGALRSLRLCVKLLQ